MKRTLTLLFLLTSVLSKAQSDTGAHAPAYRSYERYSIIATGAVGFGDGYRNGYTVPSGFEKGNTSGFTPLFAKLEYAFYKNISVAATFGYDAFYYNFKQDYTGNNGPFTRYRNDNTRIISGGITAYYHLGHIIRVHHLDPFVGIGVSINNIRYGAYPQGDSTSSLIQHNATAYLKAGARYYVSSQCSLYGDIGYEKESIVSLGVSFRFFDKKRVFNGPRGANIQIGGVR